MSKRDKRIYSLYTEGMSLQDISEKYNLSIEHLELICRKEAYYESRLRASGELMPLLDMTTATPSMSMRMFNALTGEGIYTVDSLRLAIPLILTGKLHVRGIGQKAMTHLEEMLGSRVIAPEPCLYGKLSFEIDSKCIADCIQRIVDGESESFDLGNNLRVYKVEIPGTKSYTIRIDILEQP